MAVTAVQGNPITVTGTTTTNDAVSTYGPIYVKFVYWYNPTTVGHLVSLKDRNGKAITIGKCEIANKSLFLPVFTSFPDIYCDDMDSGSLYIYVK